MESDLFSFSWISRLGLELGLQTALLLVTITPFILLLLYAKRKRVASVCRLSHACVLELGNKTLIIAK